MIFMYSVNDPGSFYMSETEVHPEIRHAEACRVVQDPSFLEWLSSQLESFHELPEYPGTFGFFPNWDDIPTPAVEEDPEPSCCNLSTAHLTFTLGDLIKKVL